MPRWHPADTPGEGSKYHHILPQRAARVRNIVYAPTGLNNDVAPWHPAATIGEGSKYHHILPQRAARVRNIVYAPTGLNNDVAPWHPAATIGEGSKYHHILPQRAARVRIIALTQACHRQAHRPKPHTFEESISPQCVRWREGDWSFTSSLAHLRHYHEGHHRAYGSKEPKLLPRHSARAHS